MGIPRSTSRFFLAVLLSLIPMQSANAGVFISVGFAPPALPVYVQPPCPEPNLIWIPGYWAYDYDAQGYYWVPGAWAPAPYEGALWTPPYWGWQEGVYAFHPGYWGWHVGYYGGVNYGFGYMGIGFVGGEWHEHSFAYNTAVVNVNRTVIHNTYINNTIVQNNTIINNNHVAYSGGRDGIQHQPTSQERMAMNEQHVPPTQFQQQHMQSARAERASFFNENHGRPQTVALARPLPAEHHDPPPAPKQANLNGFSARPGANINGNPAPRGDYRNFSAGRPGGPGVPVQPPANVLRPQNESRPAGPRNQPQTLHPAPESHPAIEPRHQPLPRPSIEPRPAPESRPQPHTDSRPAPEPRRESKPSKEPKR